MTASEPNFEQIREGSTGGKSSRGRWLFPFLFLVTNLLAACGLLLLRVAGWLQIQQSFLPLLLVGGLLSCSAVAVLLWLHRQRTVLLFEDYKHFITLALVVPVLAGMLAVHPVEGLSLTGLYFFSLTYFMAFAGVLEWLNRETALNQKGELLPFTEQAFSEKIEDEQESEASTLNHEAIFAALLEQDESTSDQSENGFTAENCSQWMNRSSDKVEGEVVEGGSLVQFKRNQRLFVVHLSLNPPLEGALAVSCEVEYGDGIRTRVLETRAYGVSIEVKRTHDLQAIFQTVLHYRITSQKASEEVA